MAEIEEQERFKVTDLETANWCLKKISNLQKDINEKVNFANAEIARTQEWLKTETDKNISDINYFKSLLNEYLTELRQENPKAKISTPYGTVSTKKTQPKWNYDEDKIKTFLKETGLKGYIRIKEEIDKVALKKDLNIIGNNVVDENGQIIEGITIDPVGEEIIVKVVE